MEKWFNVGKIVNTHGLRGEVRVISRTDFADERYKVGNTLYFFSEPNTEVSIPLTVKHHRKHKNFDLLTFEGYDSIQAVEGLKNGLLKIKEEQLTELDEGEFYFHEIIGCEVYLEDGEKVGKVREILTPGANDVWVVKGNRKEYYIPYIAEVIKTINIDERKITIKPMEGLLD
ncbi:ribosome maturation factor RimM [Bacillus carboniphilus]|uniref:Ribosome maturation factor RimM n=1 Tax=Bacillus carboniphilus TaxID=86663 RepID=A0ABN0WBD5_9BACI